MGKMNRDIPNPREMLPFEAFEEAQIVEELEQQLLLAVQFKYNNGLVRQTLSTTYIHTLTAAAYRSPTSSSTDKRSRGPLTSSEVC